MSTSARQTIRWATRMALVPVVIAACNFPPPAGTQIGALREPDPSPQLPVDFKGIDLAQAIADAIAIGGATTLTAAWQGHLAALADAPAACPQIWIGPLPEDLADVDMGDEGGFSWVANCTTPRPDNVAFTGFNHWSGTTDGITGSRVLISDSAVTADDGTVLFAFDGETADSIDGDGAYTSTFDGTLGGTLVGLGAGLRTGGGFEASWSPAGTMRLMGTVTALDGFGPADGRDPNFAPELRNVPNWTQGMPRFTSIRFDLEITAECPQEPVGYIGIRGNEGFWFDTYFLPLVTESSVLAQAFPHEQIDNVSCDGIGTLFSRNIDLRTEDDNDAQWSREVAPDFAGVLSNLALPNVDDFIYTLRHLPQSP